MTYDQLASLAPISDGPSPDCSTNKGSVKMEKQKRALLYIVARPMLRSRATNWASMDMSPTWQYTCSASNIQLLYQQKGNYNDKVSE